MRNINFEVPAPADKNNAEEEEKKRNEEHIKNRMGSILVEKDGKLERLDGGQIEKGV
jgi:hypothetical protein